MMFLLNFTFGLYYDNNDNELDLNSVSSAFKYPSLRAGAELEYDWLSQNEEQR